MPTCATTRLIQVARHFQDASSEAEQIPNARFVLHCHVQVAARDTGVGVSSRVSNFGQRRTAGQGVANKRVATVVNCQRIKPGGAKNFARRADRTQPAARSVA